MVQQRRSLVNACAVRTAPVKDEAASRPPELHYELRIADHALECRSVFLLRFLPFSQKRINRTVFKVVG